MVSRWHCCPHCTSISALVAMASLPLLRWHICPCCNGIFTIAVLVSLRLLGWPLHHHFTTSIVALVLLASLPSLHRHCCPTLDVGHQRRAWRHLTTLMPYLVSLLSSALADADMPLALSPLQMALALARKMPNIEAPVVMISLPPLLPHVVLLLYLVSPAPVTILAPFFCHPTHTQRHRIWSHHRP